MKIEIIQPVGAQRFETREQYEAVKAQKALHFGEVTFIGEPTSFPCLGIPVFHNKSDVYSIKRKILYMFFVSLAAPVELEDGEMRLPGEEVDEDDYESDNEDRKRFLKLYPEGW